MRNTFTALLALAFFFGASMAPSPAPAQDLKTVERMSYEQALSTYRDCGLRKRAVDAFVQRMRRSEKATAEPTATINVNYSPDFPAEARAAFSRAVEAWEVRIASPVPIELNARWEALGGNTLGAAGPLFTLVDTNADGSGDTILGFPLYDALTGQDQAPGEPDIVARFNSTRTDWHFGEGPAPPGTLDFTSIVLHEIAHGLGYVDFFYQVGTQISGYGFDFDGSGQVEADEQAPGPYARRLFQRSGSGGAFLTNEAAFSNPSRALGDALTSGQLVFDALQSVRGARESDGPVPPKVYAPSTFQPGSSIAHLDERTYVPSSDNALMTPRIGTAETHRRPGPVVCGQFRDLGWTLGPECDRYFPNVYALESRSAETDGGLRLAWRVDDDATVEEYVVERRYFDGPFEVVRRIDADTLSSPTVAFEELGIGAFAFRLRWTRADGTEGQIPEPVRDTVTVQDPTAKIESRDEQGRGTVALSWAEPPGTGAVTYRVERRSGEAGAFQTLGTETQTRYVAARQAPGRYQYRVVAEDPSGNLVAAAPQEVQIPFEGEVFVLGPYPNPVQGSATLDLTARDGQTVTVGVYDVLGQRVYRERRTLRAQESVSLRVDARRWASGTYFLRVQGDQFAQTRKLVVVQ
mgnify:FL=1